MLGWLHEGNDSCGCWPANSTTVSKSARGRTDFPCCRERVNQQFKSRLTEVGPQGALSMTSQQLELIARRGLTLPEPTLTRLRTVGIWCEANLTVQRRDQDWLIRGQESGGAVNDIGRYVSFCKEDGSALPWLQP